MRPSLTALVLVAGAASGADKPAAVQVCVQLPGATPLFATSARPFMRSVGADTWMLDFDVTVNGHAPERITRSGPDCFRAWLPAEHLDHVALEFARLPLNLRSQDRPVDLQLKADLWSDAGRFVIERDAWATAENRTDGTLTLTWNGVVISDWQQLPRGAYQLGFTPAPQPKSDCPITLQVRGVGTVRADRHPELYRELVAFYRAEFLPAVAARTQLQCEPAEAAQVTVVLVDGAFRNPLAPAIELVRVPEKEPHYELSVDGQPTPFTPGMTLTLEPGQRLVLAEPALQAAR